MSNNVIIVAGPNGSGNRAVKKAQEENRKKGIPNVYDINGHLYYELPNGELTKEDPL